MTCIRVDYVWFFSNYKMWWRRLKFTVVLLSRLLKFVNASKNGETWSNSLLVWLVYKSHLNQEFSLFWWMLSLAFTRISALVWIGLSEETHTASDSGCIYQSCYYGTKIDFFSLFRGSDFLFSSFKNMRCFNSTRLMTYKPSVVKAYKWILGKNNPLIDD